MTASNFLKDKSGATVVVFALSASVLVGVTALAITTGEAYSVRSKTQQALDAAVLAGAGLPYGATRDERITAATEMYRANRSPQASGDPDVTSVETAPATFTVSDTTVYGDVVLEMTSPFLGALGKSTLQIKVSSIARKRTGAPVCVLGLDPTEEATMDFNGEANLEINYCASQANSSNGNGLRQVGHPSFKAKEIGVTGGFTGSGYSPQPIAGTTPIPDPYAALSEPPLDSCHSMSGQMLQQTTATLTPGTYCGGLWIKAQSVITLSPGNYIMKDGPLTIDSGATVSGDEVMIAFVGETSSMYLIGGATLAVTSPTSGTYKNIQFFGDRKVYSTKQESLWFSVIGESKLTYDGVLYAPTFHVWWAGGSLIEGRAPSYIAVAKKLWFQDHTQVRLQQMNSRNLSVEASAPLEYGTALFR